MDTQENIEGNCGVSSSLSQSAVLTMAGVQEFSEGWINAFTMLNLSCHEKGLNTFSASFMQAEIYKIFLKYFFIFFILNFSMSNMNIRHS